MSLLRVIRDHLLFAGKCDPIHFGFCSFAVKENFLMDMSQLGADGTCGPLQRSTRFDSPSLMSKVPDFVVPVLQLDIAEVGPSGQQQFHRTNMKTGCG